jgi:peptidoglycan/LPS O-acetylase OafA/YrhL
MSAIITPDHSSALAWTTGTGRRARRTDLDGLRILLCGSIILLHASLIFAAEPIYHLKSAEPSPIASVLLEFTRVTTLVVFFALAGWSAVTVLRRCSPGRFVQERAQRLLPPLFGGMVLFGSAIKYIELSHGRHIGLHGFRLVQPLQIGVFEFFPHNLTRMNQVTWSHLWFLAYLFLFSVVLLPLLVYLARSVPKTVIPSAPIVYFPAFALALVLIAFDGYWPHLPNLYTDWANFAYWTLCFAIGAGIAAWPGFETRLHAEAPRLLLFMAVAFVGVILCGESAAGRLFVGLTAWGAIGAGLGVAGRINPPATPLFVYLVEATMPVYIVHHVPLLLLGIILLPLAIPVWLKIVLIWLGTSAVSLAAYHWLIRPWTPVRWLMGMYRSITVPTAMPVSSVNQPPI